MNEKLVSYKKYVAGWLDTSMHDFLSVLPPNRESTRYALITCLDSHRKPASLRRKSPELRPITKHLHVVGNALFLATELLVETELRSQIFFGFDEVWFFPGEDIEPKPDSEWLVGPPRLNQSRLKKLGDWMSNNSCSLGLGGGEGLNFVVKAHGLVKYVLGFTIEQPELSSIAFEAADAHS